MGHGFDPTLNQVLASFSSSDACTTELQVGEPDTCTLPAGVPATVSNSTTDTYDTDAGMQEEEEENVY